VSVIAPGNGQLNPALASRFKVNRTVDGATPIRRAISLSPTPTVVKRSTSRTWRIVVLSAGIRSPVQKPKERTLIWPAEAPRARSSRNGGRNHLGTPSKIKSERWATSSRIRGRLPPESAQADPGLRRAAPVVTAGGNEAHRSAQFPGLCVLLSRDVDAFLDAISASLTVRAPASNASPLSR
jgi:hypothetical protein